MPAIELSKADARRLLVSYHFSPSSAKGVFSRLGSVQYDPLKPLGSNHDLVLQARVPDYNVDDWQTLAYQDRFIYDGWDKQASLVMTKDWPLRRIYHHWNKQYWQKRVLRAYPKAINIVLQEIKTRGPLSSTELNYQAHEKDWEETWYGPKIGKNVLRALWHTGVLATHHRDKGRHVYDLAENVIPSEYLRSTKLSKEQSERALVLQRHKAVGLLRPTAGADIWSMEVKSFERRAYIAQLLEQKELLAVLIDGKEYHAIPELFAAGNLQNRMIFLAPLDQLIWDRVAVRHIFEFDYVWEVYKPQKQRKWGYYVLPVLYNDNLVARFDSRYKDGIWELYKWYWEDGISINAKILAALELAVAEFKKYLGAQKIKLNRGMDLKTRQAWQLADKL